MGWLFFYKKMSEHAPIGVFDSGYGGLTVLKDLRKLLPQYDYIYLGDNARAPYGSRSFDSVYRFTLECVRKLFDQGCQLVILACNTGSAKALRTIQQKDLPVIDSCRRVLGVIRPTAEIVGSFSKTGKVGVLGTTGTVVSGSYPIEISKFFPDLEVFQEACPMWVPLIENGEHLKDGADYFVAQHIEKIFLQDPNIDTLVLGCTHYPLLAGKIGKYVPTGVRIIDQGIIVAESLKDYLHRHPQMEERCSKRGTCRYCTTDNPEIFNKKASIFLGFEVTSEAMVL